MPTLLVRNARFVATLDADDRHFENCDILVSENRIRAIGGKLDGSADRVLDASGMLVMPGMVNTHHHLFQALTRAVPRVQDAELFPWLVHLYEVWRHLTPEALYWACLVGMGELLLTGCTTTTDHTYLYPSTCPPDLFDHQIRAARQIGIRFHPTRGAMSLGRTRGGLPPDDVVQNEETILRDFQRVIEVHHDRDLLGMIKVALAPCAPFTVSPDLMRETAAMARRHGVRLHTHLAETRDEDAYCLQKFGVRPFDFVESHGWVGPDVWYAHCIYLNDDEIRRAARTGTGVAHCPVSNLRLGSGIAPIPEMLAAGVPVGLGVDGSASNDSSDMLGEVRACMLVHRLRGMGSITARTALRLATKGGARVLGYPDLGTLEVGAGADFIGISLERLGYAGAMHDPLAAIVLCGDSHVVDFSVVDGKVVVEHGRLVGVDEREVWENANRVAAEMVANAEKRTGISYLSKDGPGLPVPRPSMGSPLTSCE